MELNTYFYLYLIPWNFQPTFHSMESEIVFSTTPLLHAIVFTVKGIHKDDVLMAR